MSKADGKKIAVKFTLPITSPMIGMVYNQPIDMDVSLFSASYNASNLSRLLDNTEALGWPYAYRKVNTWFEINFPSPIEITEISLTSASGGYYPTWTLQGWDGLAWVNIQTGVHSGYNQDITYSFTAVEYQKIRVLAGGTRVGNYPGFYNLRLRGNFSDYLNRTAFSITGQEYQYINGPTLNKSYKIISVESHPTEARTLLITVDQFDRFNNVEGQLKVSYDSALGTLVGVGGAVQSFDAYFTPLDLLREISPNDEETVRTVISNVTLNYDLISYINASSTEEHTINAVASVVVEYTDVTIVNP